MKYFFICVILALSRVPAGAEKVSEKAGRFFTWGLRWSGSWEESKILAERGELRFGNPQTGLLLRGQVLDKRPMDFSVTPPWKDHERAITAFAGGLYHKPSGSRLLYGILDEWGLSARIRSPWIRGAPFAENHQPLFADLKTVTSAEKKPEAYLYLSSPALAFIPKTALRVFASAQTLTEEFSPDFAGGVEALFTKKTRILLEGFYTDSKIPAGKSSAWFADPPPPPEREFRLYALGLLAGSPFLSLSSDWACSETFAQGRGLYGNAGIRINPPFSAPWGKPGPWSLSLAADGTDNRFTGRDGKNPGAAFRTAGKLEWKGKGTSMFRFSTSLRAPALGESFTRSSTAAYFRFPVSSRKKTTDKNTVLGIRRVSLGADRNADNPSKIIDSIDGSLGLSLSLLPLRVTSPLGINFSGSVKGLCSAGETPPPYPLPPYPYSFNSAKVSGELSWSPGIFQFRTKWGYERGVQNEDRWNASFTTSVRYKVVRAGIKITSPDFPDKWNCTLSWHLEKK